VVQQYTKGMMLCMGLVANFVLYFLTVKEFWRSVS